MTIESAGIPPAPPVEAAPTKNSFERLVGVFFYPTETFRDIARKPDILIPLIILTLFGFATTLLIMPHLDFDALVAQQAEMMQKKNPNISDADLAQMGRFTKAMAKVGGYFGPVFIIIGYLVIALVLWGAFRLMGGAGDFKQSLSTTLYAYMPRMLLGGIIGTIIVMARGMVDPTQMASLVKTSPAFLVEMKEQPMLFALLSSLDVFVLWTLFLLVLGFSIVSRLSRAKSAAIVITLWLITVVVKLGFAALNAAQMKG
jgi:Yip1 domain